MPRFQCSFESKVLLAPAAMTVTLPFPAFDPASPGQVIGHICVPKEKFKTLYLLRSAFAYASSWSLHSRVEAYIEQHEVAAAIPSIGNSFYADLLHFPAYEEGSGEHIWEFWDQYICRSLEWFGIIR
jgi:hypothetical protein